VLTLLKMQPKNVLWKRPKWFRLLRLLSKEITALDRRWHRNRTLFRLRATFSITEPSLGISRTSSVRIHNLWNSQSSLCTS
jgi:hypothetical protein